MNKYESLTEVTQSTEMIFDGVILHVYRDTVTLPNGKPATREVIRHVGAVGIIPVTDDGRVIIEKQFRYPVNKVIVEIPAGKLDSKSENRLDAAKRELREETGITADEWIELGDCYTAAAYTDENLTLFMARGLHYGDQKLDEDEFLNIETVPLSALVDDVMAGRITDGKTQIAILKAARLILG